MPLLTSVSTADGSAVEAMGAKGPSGAVARRTQYVAAPGTSGQLSETEPLPGTAEGIAGAAGADCGEAATSAE